MDSQTIAWRAAKTAALSKIFVLEKCAHLRFNVFLPRALRGKDSPLFGEVRTRFSKEVQSCVLQILDKGALTNFVGAAFDPSLRHVFYLTFLKSSELEEKLKNIIKINTSFGDMFCALRIEDPEGTTAIYFLEGLPDVSKKTVETILFQFLGKDWENSVSKSKDYPEGYAVNCNNKTNNLKVFIKNTVPFETLLLVGRGRIPIVNQFDNHLNFFVNPEISFHCDCCNAKGHKREGCPLTKFSKELQKEAKKDLVEIFTTSRDHKKASKKEIFEVKNSEKITKKPSVQKKILKKGEKNEQQQPEKESKIPTLEKPVTLVTPVAHVAHVATVPAAPVAPSTTPAARPGTPYPPRRPTKRPSPPASPVSPVGAC